MEAAGVSVAADAASDPLVLALDVGTSSARALVYEGKGRAVSGLEVHKPYTVTTTADGGITVDADELVDLSASCLDAVTASLRNTGKTLSAVAFDTFWHSLLGLDRAGRPVTPVYMWGDTRSADAARELQKRLDGRQVHARTGVELHSSYWPAKLVWLRQTSPETVAKVAHWVSFGEYLYLRIFGELRVSVSMASGTGLFDQNACGWDGEMLEAAGVRAGQLSPLADFTDPFQSLREPYASRWPQLASVPWFLAVGDGAASNIGSGGSREDRVVIMVGTSGALRVVREVERVRLPDGIWTYRVDGRRFVQGGALSAGGNVMAWASRALRFDTLASIEEQVATATPDAHGLTILPFLAGERSPDWNVDAESAIVGITLHTTPVDLVQALLESVTYRFGLVYSIIRREIPMVRAIIGSGAGLVQSPTWTQIMTDVLNQPIALSAVAEASSRGAALLVLEHLGAVEDLSALEVPVERTFTPHQRRAAAYAAAMERQQKLYRRLLG